MKRILLLVCLGVALRAQVCRAQYFTDTFTGNSVNSTYWRTIFPLSTSTVVESNGSLTTQGRGILATVQANSAPYMITGTFTMLSSIEHFNIVLRSDLSSAGAAASYERAGVLVSFAMDGQGYSIQNYSDAPSSFQVGVGTYPFIVGKPYSFTITDTGTTVSVTIDGNTPLTASTTFQTGNYTAFYSREIPGCSTRLDSLTFSTIPGAQVITNTVTVQVPNTNGQLVNLSTLGTGSFTSGFAISGTTPETVLIRGDGPTLKSLGVTGAATQTALTLYTGSTVIGANSGWSASSNASQIAAAFASTGAFSLPSGSADSAILTTLNPGTYTATVSGNGAVLLEVYQVP